MELMWWNYFIFILKQSFESHNRWEQINKSNQSTNSTYDNFQKERMDIISIQYKNRMLLFLKTFSGSDVMSHFFIHKLELIELKECIQTKLELTIKSVIHYKFQYFPVNLNLCSKSVNVEETQRSSQNVCSHSHPQSGELKQVISIQRKLCMLGWN